MDSQELKIDELEDREVIRLFALLGHEARRRKLRTAVGEVGEYLVLDLFARRPDLPKLMLSAPGTKNVDALSRSGERFSIKTIQYGSKSGTIYPDAMDSERPLFEFIVVALVAPDMTLQRAVMFDWKGFCAVRKWDVRMSAWYISRSEKSLSHGAEIFPKNDSVRSAGSASLELRRMRTGPAVR